MFAHTDTTGTWVTTVTLFVKEWGTLRVSTREYGSEEDAHAAGEAYLARRFAREAALGLDPFLSTDAVTANRPSGPLHRNVWMITYSQR